MLDLHQIFFMYFDECSVTLFEGFLRVLRSNKSNECVCLYRNYHISD